MKKTLILITVFVVMTGALYAQNQQANQEPDFYTQQLDSQATMTAMDRVVQNAAADGAGAEFFAHALDRVLLLLPNVTGTNELTSADNMALFLSAKLGEAQYTDAGPNLWKTVETFANPLVRAEALSSLGKVQAVDFIPHVVQILSDMNLEPGKDPMNREQVAYGAIAGLEEYKDSVGYLPVFLVTVGWYTDRVKAKAREALPKIMDNPTEPLVSVIRGSSYNFTAKYAALQVLEESQVTTQQKAQGAVAGLTEVWLTNPNQGPDRPTIISMRKLSVDMIRRYGTEDAAVYPLLERTYREAVDEQEKITVAAALAALQTDDSARVLSIFLNDINNRRARGTLVQEDERLVRVVIPALGATGRPLARTALRRVLQEDWTGAVQRLAQDALKQLP
jgi:hypothetical protein